jgi:hypothetical protein
MLNDTSREHGSGRPFAGAAGVRDTGAPSLETNAPVPAISPSQKFSSREHR